MTYGWKLSLKARILKFSVVFLFFDSKRIEKSSTLWSFFSFKRNHSSLTFFRIFRNIDWNSNIRKILDNGNAQKGQYHLFSRKKNVSLYLTIDIFLMENNGGGDHFSLVHKNTSAGTNAWNSDLQVSEIPWRHGEINQFLPIFGHIPGTYIPDLKIGFRVLTFCH